MERDIKFSLSGGVLSRDEGDLRVGVWGCLRRKYVYSINFVSIVLGVFVYYL